MMRSRQIALYRVFALILLLSTAVACDGPATPTPAPATGTPVPAATTPAPASPTSTRPAPSATPPGYPVASATPGGYPAPSATPPGYPAPDDSPSFAIDGQAAALYFPFVARYRYCQAYDRVGVAWYAPSRDGLQLADMCAAQWYNAVRSYAAGVQPGQWPVYWSIYRPDGGTYLDLLATIPDYRKYTGQVVVLNEPDNVDQANLTARQAAQELVRVAELMPEACLVWPNVILPRSLDYLRQALAELDAIDGLQHICAIGVHFYASEAVDVDTRLAQLQPVLDAWGIDAPVDVTEMGVFGDFTDPAGALELWTLQALRHPRVRYVFGYTLRGCQSALCWEESPGYLTDIGHAWLRGVRAWADGQEGN